MVIEPLETQVALKSRLERRVHALLRKYGSVVRKKIFVAAANRQL